MPSGGKRAGAGRPRIKTDWKERIRKLILSPKVWRAMAKRAATDPEYALRLAEHGFGRPSQQITGDRDAPLAIRITYDSPSDASGV